MMYTKKIISASITILVTGASLLSSVSADTTEATTGTTSVSSEATNTAVTTTAENTSTSMGATTATENINSATCRNIGTRSEGWYFPSGKLYKWANCWEEMKQENKQDEQMMRNNIKQDCLAPGSCGQGLPTPSQNNTMMGNDLIKPPMPMRELGGFLRNPLTKEERDAIEALLMTQHEERKAIVENTLLTLEEKAMKIQELARTHMATILTYIDTERQDLFKKIMEERMSLMAKNKEVRKELKEEVKQQKQEFKEEIKGQKQEFKEEIKGQKQEFKKEMQAKKRALSEKNRTVLDKVIGTLPIERLQGILTKVEKALTVAKKERVIDQLKEIQELLQTKIDELTGGSSEENLLNDILSDETTANTGTTTVTQ